MRAQVYERKIRINTILLNGLCNAKLFAHDFFNNVIRAKICVCGLQTLPTIRLFLLYYEQWYIKFVHVIQTLP